MTVIKNARLRNALRILLPSLLIPAAALIGTSLLGGKRHLVVSLTVAILSLLLFYAGFERRVTGSRRAVICSVMIACAVIGRFIPFFKPISAIAILTAMYLGGESGFLVGSVSALISNFYFGQGPWTPFQMLSFGLIGLFGGILAPLLKKSRAFLLFYGALAGILYSLTMDLFTSLWYSGSLSAPVFLAAVVTALPHTVLYSVSNIIFLLILARPFCEKMERIVIKYGI